MIIQETLTTDDEFLIMASDGVWDVFTNEVGVNTSLVVYVLLLASPPAQKITTCFHLAVQDAVTLIRGISDPEKAAQKLTDEAFARGSADNISCIIARFKH